MRYWFFRLRTLLVRPNFYEVLLDAYQVRDWKTFLYCLEQEPSLVNMKMLGWSSVTPFILALDSGDYILLRKIIDLGADINQTVHYFPEFAGIDDDSRRELAKTVSAYGDPHHPFTSLSCLDLLWALGYHETHDRMLSWTSHETQYRSCVVCLIGNDLERIEKYEWQKLLSRRVLGENLVPKYTLLEACVFGSASVELFEKAWELCSQEERLHVYETAEKPHMRDDYGVTKYYSGNIHYWADHLDKKGICQFLAKKGVPLVGNVTSD